MEATDVLKEISKILTEGNVKNYIDPTVKTLAGNYLGIFRSKHKLLFTHFYEDDFIEAVTPNYLPPEEVEREYGIKGEVSIRDKHYRSANHYLFAIQLTKNEDNKLINNKYTLKDTKDFFIDIANLR